MIGWRVGWIVAPPAIIDDIGLVNISNVVCPVGLAQAAATVALQAPDTDIAAASAEWQHRRDTILRELEGFPIVKPQGGWSMLLGCLGFWPDGRGSLSAFIGKRKNRGNGHDGLGQRAERKLCPLCLLKRTRQSAARPAGAGRGGFILT